MKKSLILHLNQQNMSACAKLYSKNVPLFSNSIKRNHSSCSSDDHLVVLKKFGKVTMIGINRPDKKNAANIKLLEQISVTLNAFEEDDTSNVGILYGEGGNFCSGYDLAEIASEEYSKTILSNKLTERYVKKPLIAAISGYGVGFGFDLALWCDLRIMEENALIGYYGRRFGVPISKWSIKRLKSIVGLERCMDILLTGRGVPALEAQKIGLISKVTECGTALGQAFSLAVCIAKFPQPSLLADRAQAYAISFNPEEDLMDSINQEFDRNSKIAFDQVNEGAKMYLNGMGRHGKFSTKVETDD